VSVSCAIDAFPEPVTLRRQSVPTSVKGIVTAGPETLTPGIVMSSYPAPGDQVQRLPDGIRHNDIRSFHSRAELIGADDPGGRLPDRLTRANGVTYEALRIDDYSDQGGYWHALAVRVQVQP